MEVLPWDGSMPGKGQCVLLVGELSSEAEILELHQLSSTLSEEGLRDESSSWNQLNYSMSYYM